MENARALDGWESHTQHQIGFAPGTPVEYCVGLLSAAGKDIRAGYLLRTTLARLYIALLGLVQVWHSLQHDAPLRVLQGSMKPIGVRQPPALQELSFNF